MLTHAINSSDSTLSASSDFGVTVLEANDGSPKLRIANEREPGSKLSEVA